MEAECLITDHHDVCEANYVGLLSLLQQLDQRLAAAVTASEKVYASRSAGDLYRGLVITPEDVAAAFGCVPGEPFHTISSQLPVISDVLQSVTLERLQWLQREFTLSDFDLDVILIALAPEIDLRYERLYSYLHDDVSRRRPTVDLALNILCSDGADKLMQRRRFAPDAQMVRHRLIGFIDDSHPSTSSSLAREYRLDEQIVRFLLNDESIDSRLSSFCSISTVIENDTLAPLSEETRQILTSITKNTISSGIKLCFQGSLHCGQEEAVALVAETLHLSVLTADFGIPGDIQAQPEFDMLFTLLREGWIRNALLYVRGIDTAPETVAANLFRQLWQAVAFLPINCVVESESERRSAVSMPAGVFTVRFALPSSANRKLWWHHCLSSKGIELQQGYIAELAESYRMTYRQIGDAVAEADITRTIRATASGEFFLNHDGSLVKAVAEAARRQFSHTLASLTTRITPRATWDDLVLPEDEIAQLHGICQRFKHRRKVYGDWGFARKLTYGLGITVLFAGGSGTGKTMAAGVIANALGLDLYRIDLAQVVSKYIGETEKNLDRIFNAAENANAILFFDEADALFGKRSEVRDSHDRYANLEISYLLQKMEQYEGISILATNLSDNIDQAFARRLAFSIHFPFPDESARLRLWQLAWPDAVPLSLSVDRELLARELKIAGGNIRNIALGAAFNAAGNGGVVDMEHILDAARQEYQKIGKTFSDRNLTPQNHDR